MSAYSVAIMRPHSKMNNFTYIKNMLIVSRKRSRVPLCDGTLADGSMIKDKHRGGRFKMPV